MQLLFFPRWQVFSKKQLTAMINMFFSKISLTYFVKCQNNKAFFFWKLAWNLQKTAVKARLFCCSQTTPPCVYFFKVIWITGFWLDIWYFLESLITRQGWIADKAGSGLLTRCLCCHSGGPCQAGEMGRQTLLKFHKGKSQVLLQRRNNPTHQ